MNLNLSVLIVTKNRQADLTQCLGSILANRNKPKEIVVIDNNSTDGTKQLIDNFTKNSEINLKYANFKGKGYPTIYNKGIELTSSNWVAVIDDDCVADINWIGEITKSIKRNPKAAAILGWSKTYNRSIYSLVTMTFDNEWKRRSIREGKIVDCEILDNKNIVYNKDFLTEKKISYDELRVIYQNGAAEDCDLGIQIQENGGKAFVNYKMIIEHKDPTDFIWYMRKTVGSWHAYRSLNYKWNLKNRDKMKLPAKTIQQLVNECAYEYNLNLFDKIGIFLLMKITMFVNNVLELLFGNKYEK